eukprot:NODE_17_length_41373_cov_0.337016.p18 type:complete len:248 gc:universal NODE_17_length_41373_cov_0.337016:19465-20208(+)
MDYYSILGVKKTASADEIKQQYKKLALRHHPDRCHGKTEREQTENMRTFQKVGEAFEILSDPLKRSQYDHKDVYNYKGFEMHNPFDIFSEIFGNNNWARDTRNASDIFGGADRMFMDSFIQQPHPMHSGFQDHFNLYQPHLQRPNESESMKNYNKQRSRRYPLPKTRNYQQPCESSGRINQISFTNTTSTSRSQSTINGVTKIRTVKKDVNGNVEEIDEVHYGKESARVVKVNGIVTEQRGNSKLLQ